MNSLNELRTVFEGGFARLKETFYKMYKIEGNDNDILPSVLSLRDMIESLPPHTIAIEITGPENHERLKNGRGFLMKYDLNNLKSDHFEFCGTVDYTQPEKLESLIIEKFKIDKNEISGYAEDLCKGFDILGCSSSSSWYLHFIPDDIIKNPETFYKQLTYTFLNPPMDILYSKFRRTEYPDYNKIFNLKPDPVLSLKELLESGNDGFNYDLHGLQKSIADIQLIPSVPDMVKRVFKRAKDLFIFGCFRYEFFTISQHYALLALEAAIKARYIASLDNMALLTDSKNPLLRDGLQTPSYRDIEKFIKNGQKGGWDQNRLLVNNEPFPSSGKKLVNWLLKKQLVRKWEAQYYDIGLQLRNSMSHLEFASIVPPSATMLKHVADQINHLFYTPSNLKITDGKQEP